MKQIVFVLLSIILGQIVVFGQTTNETPFELAVQDVDIFDSRTRMVLKNRTILINGDTIAAIIDASEKFKAAKTIKGKGRLVVPGFVDTHTHILQTYGVSEIAAPQRPSKQDLDFFKKQIARQYLANGVTTIMDMAQPESWIEETVEIQKNPAPDFPNFFINGSSTISDLRWDRNPPMHHEKIYSAEDGKKKVQKYARLGIKHMKLYWKLEEADMKAVIDEAKKYDITLNAHVDNNIVTIPQAMDLGVKNFEHFFTVIPSILNFDENYPALNKKYELPRNRNIDTFAANMVFFFGYIDDDPALKSKMHDLFKKMAEKNVSISTAVNVLATAAGKSYSFSTFDPFPPRVAPNLPYSDSQKQQLSEAFDVLMKYVREAHDAGVKIRIGTDTRYGGKAFLSELIIFSEAGFPVQDVLQIATWNGAEAMKISDRFGSIEKGKKADLIIYENNPLDDYKHFQGKTVVIKGGKIFETQKSLAFSFAERIEKKGFASARKWFQRHKKTGKFGPLDEAEMNEIGFQFLAKGKVEEALAVYRLNKVEFPESGNVHNGLTENQTNIIGYSLLQDAKVAEAVDMFHFNVVQHPQSANAYDSLGEAYLTADKKELALTNYKKSFEINPKNYNALNVINKIEGTKITIEKELLVAYVGEYQIDPKMLFTISSDGEKLFWQQKGRDSKLELEPVTEERFVFAGTNESLLFEKVVNGKVSGLTLDQNGRITKLTRVITKPENP